MLQETIILSKFISNVIKPSISYRVLLLGCFLLITSTIFSQEVGSIKKGNHSIALLKLKDTYSLAYSDVSSSSNLLENTIHFSIKETVYEIIMNGFGSDLTYQIILHTTNDTIVKLEFRDIKGQRMLKIMQNNLAMNTFGTSIFYTKSEMQTLFAMP